MHAAQSTILSLVALSGNKSHGFCLCGQENKILLDNFNVSPSYRCFKESIAVTWKSPIARWTKVNTDGSLIGSLNFCGGIFRDYRGI